MTSVAPFFYIIVIGIIFIAIVWISMSFDQSRANNMLEQWAQQNGYQLVNANRSFWKIGTPFWLTKKYQHVYRVTMQDQYGNILTGYALCGGRYMGMWSERVEVKWDHESGEKRKNDFVKRKNDW